MQNEWLQTFNNMYCFFMLLVYPLTMRNGYFDVATTKLVFFYTVSLIFILSNIFIRLIYFIMNKDLNANPLPLAEKIIYLFFFLCITVTFIINYKNITYLVAPEESHNSIVFLTLCLLTLYFLRQAPINKTLFCACACIGALGVCLIAVLQHFNLDPGSLLFNVKESARGSKFKTTIGNGDIAGFYFNIILPFTFYLTTKKRWFLLGLVGFTSCTIGAVISNTDAAIACLGVEFTLLVIFCSHVSEFKYSYPACLAVSGIGLAITGYIANKTEFTREIAFIPAFILKPIIGLSLVGIAIVLFIILCFLPVVAVKILGILAFLCIFLYPVLISYYTTSREIISSAKNLPYDSFLLWNNNWGSGRGWLWRISIGIFKDSDLLNKILGVGAQGYVPKYKEFCMNYPDFAQYEDFVYYDAHNMYIHFLVEYGIIGLISSLSLIGYRLVSLIRFADDDCFYRTKAVAIVTSLVSAVFLFCSNVSMAFIPILFL